jgi:hypothetical protein
MFCDITWGAGGSTADLTLDIASKMQNMARREPATHALALCARARALRTRSHALLRRSRSAWRP